MRPRGPVAVLTTVLVAALTAFAPQPAQAEEADGDPGRLLLVLDSSGSMKGRAGSGGTKIEAARKALTDVVEALPDDAQVGMRVFGQSPLSLPDPKACTDTRNVVPVGTLDRAAMTSAIAAYTPNGETPIGNALLGAAEDLGPDGKRTIVLMSDGEPTCAPDPCQVARDLRAQGVDLKVNVVGLGVSGVARDKLRCIAKAGGGTYQDVQDADDLADSLVQVSVRAFRTFALTGEPVTGGTTTARPLALEPGTFTDTSEGTSRYYTVERPENGRVVVSGLSRPAYAPVSVRTMEVELMTADGTSCNRGIGLQVAVLKTQSLLSTSAAYSPNAAGAKGGCDEADTLIARVAQKADAGTPFQLTVRTEPEITDLDSLPDAASGDEVRDLADAAYPVPTGTPTAVVGGPSFADATELEPATLYRDTLRPGEQLVYRVPVGWGQRLRARATLETDPQAAAALGRPGVVSEMEIFSGDLVGAGRTGERGGGFWDGERPAAFTAEGTPVRARNVESFNARIRSVASAGDQYLVLSMAGTLGDDSTEFAAPVTFSVVVEGEETGEPTFAADPEESKKASGSSAQPAEDDAAGVPWLPIGIGAVVLVGVAVLGGVVALRRRG